MANWKQAGDNQWRKVENGVPLYVTLTQLGDYRAEYRGPLGGVLQIGYYLKREDAQKQCENKAFDRPVQVGKR